MAQVHCTALYQAKTQGTCGRNFVRGNSFSSLASPRQAAESHCPHETPLRRGLSRRRRNPPCAPRELAGSSPGCGNNGRKSQGDMDLSGMPLLLLSTRRCQRISTGKSELLRVLRMVRERCEGQSRRHSGLPQAEVRQRPAAAQHQGACAAGISIAAMAIPVAGLTACQPEALKGEIEIGQPGPRSSCSGH